MRPKKFWFVGCCFPLLLGPGCPSPGPTESVSSNPPPKVLAPPAVTTTPPPVTVTPNPTPVLPDPPPSLPPPDPVGPVTTPDKQAEPQSFVYTLSAEECNYIWVESCWSSVPIADPMGSYDPLTLLMSYDQTIERHHIAFFKLPVTLLPSTADTVTMQLFCRDVSGGYQELMGYFAQEPFSGLSPGEAWRPFCQKDTPFQGAGSTLTSFWEQPISTGDWVTFTITDYYQRWIGTSWDKPKPNNGFGLCTTNGIGWAKFASADPAVPHEERPRVIINYHPVVPRQLVCPLTGKFRQMTIISYFGDWWEGKICPTSKDTKLLHTGVDLAANLGDPVFAALTGTIRCANTHPTDGGFVALEHADNNGQLIYTTTYTHVAPLLTILPGQRVIQGQQIGTVTFNSSNVPHLHFQVRMAPYDSVWSLRGRFPEVECNGELEWPGGYTNPALLCYER